MAELFLLVGLPVVILLAPYLFSKELESLKASPRLPWLQGICAAWLLIGGFVAIRGTGLSSRECGELAGLLQKGNAALDQLRAERFSESGRQNAASVTEEIKAWLEENVGPAEGQAFMSAGAMEPGI